MTALRFDFDVQPAALPFCGNTPAAKHASWTGSQAAAITRGSNLLKLLSWFSVMNRMTFADFAKFMGKSEHALCSTWAAAKESGWIVGTGENYSYACNGRIVHREIHAITERGRKAQFERLRAKVMQIEGLSNVDMDAMETTKGSGGTRGERKRQKAVEKAAEELR